MDSTQPWRQHVVSKVLLKRWTVDGQLGAYNLVYDAVEKPKGPKAFGFVGGFVAHEPKELEELWANVETQVPDVFEVVDAGELPDSGGRATLVDLCAIHIARSQTTRRMWEIALARQLEDGGRIAELVAWAKQPEVLRAWFTHESGLAPTGPEAEHWAWGQLRARLAESFGSDGTGFRSAVIEQYERARAWLGGLKMQLGYLSDGEFAVGDAPVTTFNSETRKAGLLSGVTLNAATSINLPLGPHVVMDFATSGDHRRLELGREFAVHVNARQVVCAHERVHYRPGSAVLEELREARRAFSPTA